MPYAIHLFTNLFNGQGLSFLAFIVIIEFIYLLNQLSSAMKGENFTDKSNQLQEINEKKYDYWSFFSFLINQHSMLNKNDQTIQRKSVIQYDSMLVV